MSRLFVFQPDTETRIEYNGFTPGARPMSEADIIAVTICECESKVYSLDDSDHACSELIRYLCDVEENGGPVETIVGIYHRK